jgi:hypothetical protein
MKFWRTKMQVFGLALLAATALTQVALANSLPFEIKVDGKRIDGTTLPPAAGAGATTDAAEGPVDVQVKYDGLGVQPTLNVSTLPPQVSFTPGSAIKFLISLNYPGYIQKAEIRIYESGTNNLVDTIQVNGNAVAEWQMPSDVPDEMDYVLRVYDFDGRFDETRARTIFASSLPRANLPAAVSPGAGEDFTATRNIDVSGGAVTIIGKNVPSDHDVKIMGEPVAVDGGNTFVLQRILPPGAQSVAVSIQKDGQGLDFAREVTIPDSEWFYVGLADLTAGLRLKKNIETVTPDEYDRTWTRGRLAFYLKGKMKGQYILTAAADTSEQKLKHIFRGLDEKDPREFLRRIDPDDYYPVYGDDSTSVEDAPTQGKFYIRLERGPSHVMWGNFKTSITGTKFLRSERAVYGASAVHRSKAVVPNGEARTAVDAYAALPGTLPQRDILRATGGSAYFLKHQDITTGSETISVERRNRTTGWVIATRQLQYADDFTIDYAQGVIILKNPLPSNDGDADNFLVAAYEYTPSAANVDGYVTGGRVHQWLGNHVRVGVSGQREKTAGADQKVVGADLHVEATPNTYAEVEVARSKGPGFGNSYSPDGGLTIQDNATAGTAGKTADAWRAEARVDLADVTDGQVKGKLQARAEKHEKGFASVDVQATENRFSWGVEADAEVSERARVAATYSESKQGTRLDREGQAKMEVPLTEHVSVTPYTKYTEQKRVISTEEQGKRWDVGSRITYRHDEDNEAYVFGQVTAKHTGSLGKDHRAGAGIKKQITDRLGFEGEASQGTQGIDAKAYFTYEPSAESRYYLGYRLDANRDGGGSGGGSWPFALVGEDMGTVVAGSHLKINDKWTMYGEDTADFFGRRRSLTQTYGVTYTPNDLWTYSGALEMGDIFDNTYTAAGVKNPDTRRLAASTTVSYRDDQGLEGKIKGEYRRDNSEAANKDLQSWLLQSAISVKVSDDWRALSALDLVVTDADETVREGNYAEGSLGFAYRPTDNDKVTALVKYTYLYDNPGQDQVTVDGTLDGASQRSQIFSADINYDIVPQVTLGAKYGFRIGEIKDRTAGADWTNSQAHLAILRADWHVVHQWDAVMEGRLLWSPTTDQSDFGFLVAVYRQLSDNLKLGVGYNFGRFSDDLRDLTHDDAGVFINVVGTF